MSIVFNRRVVITGIGQVVPNGDTTGEFWQALLDGRSVAGPVSAFDASRFPTTFAAEARSFKPENHFSSKEINRLDRSVQFAIVAARMAVDDCGIDFDRTDRDRCGVLIGSGIGGLITVQEAAVKADFDAPIPKVSPYLIPKFIINMASGEIAIRHGLNGPNVSQVTACATGIHAVGDAMKIIQREDADVMVAGGAEAAICFLGFGGFCSMKALSRRNDDPRRASRPFDLNRDGFVMGEGAGVVVLEELDHAQKRGARIYAEVLGYGLTCDAHHPTEPHPEGRGAARCMQMALRDARINPEQISYINAHGTSTKFNDQRETLAIRTVFGAAAKKIPVSSTKSTTGHLLGAAGAVETIICALAIHRGAIPPTSNYETPDPECDLDYVPNTARDATLSYIMNNSFGFGGHNACMVVGRCR